MHGKRFTKIVCKDQVVRLHLEEQIREKEIKETVLRAPDEPHPDFVNAMRALVDVVRHILQLPETYEPGITISQVSFSYNDDKDNKGAVITGLIRLETSDTPFCFNTPYLPYQSHSETSDSPVMPGFAVELLDKVEVEASAYIGGKRLQLSLLAA